MPRRRHDTHPMPNDRLPRHRAGFTLVELLVASTLGLMTMAALASLFATFGKAVSQSQTIVDLNARMRNTAWRLRQDLHGMTAPVKPWVRAEASAGYFEVVEGVATTTNMIGDCDDRLMFTTISLGAPFTGRLQGTAGFESPTAEVAWFCVPSSQTYEGQTLHTLYRRQLLVSATPGAGSFQNGVAAVIDRNLSDLSCRPVGGGQVANSLADLTKAANRFWTAAGTAKTLQGDRLGEDVLLTNVLAFDIRAYSTVDNGYTNQSVNTNYIDGGAPPPVAGPASVPAGIEIRIRCIEPTSRQVRQVTVVHAFEGQ